MNFNRLSSAHLEQLVCAKYLFLHAIEELNKNGPFSTGIAISGFQDSVEMVLRVIASHHHIELKRDENFHGLVLKVSAGLGQPIPFNNELIRLNQARVSFKHFGLLIENKEAIRFKATVESFYLSTLPTILKVAYDSISIFSLIEHRRVENFLNLSEEQLASGECEESIVSSASAFSIYKSFAFSSNWRPRTDFGFSRRTAGVVTEIELLESISTKVQEHEEMLRMLRCNIFLPDYETFSLLSPNIQLSEARTLHINWQRPPESSFESAQFCLQFAADSILKMKSSIVHQRRRIEIPIRYIKVVHDSPILVWPNKPAKTHEDEVIRTATVGEVLLGYYERFDKAEYFSVLQDGEAAYISRSHVEQVDDV